MYTVADIVEALAGDLSPSASDLFFVRVIVWVVLVCVIVHVSHWIFKDKR
jgi:hypothetical protein